MLAWLEPNDTSPQAFRWFPMFWRCQTVIPIWEEKKKEQIEDIGSNTQCASVCETLYIPAIESFQSPSFEHLANTRQTVLVLSVQQTMQGKLDKRDLLEQKLQKIWAMKSISLIPIIYSVLGFPDGGFQERYVSWFG